MEQCAGPYRAHRAGLLYGRLVGQAGPQDPADYGPGRKAHLLHYGHRQLLSA